MDFYLKIPFGMLKLNISSKALLLYGIILNLSYRNDMYATNAYLAKTLDCSVRTIQMCLKELEEKGCIEIYEVGNSRRIRPLITCSVLITNEPEAQLKPFENAPECVRDFWDSLK